MTYVYLRLVTLCLLLQPDNLLQLCNLFAKWRR